MQTPANSKNDLILRLSIILLLEYINAINFIYVLYLHDYMCKIKTKLTKLL